MNATELQCLFFKITVYIQDLIYTFNFRNEMALGLRATDRIESLETKHIVGFGLFMGCFDNNTSNSISPALSFKHGRISILIYGPFCKYRSSYFLPHVVCA